MGNRRAACTAEGHTQLDLRAAFGATLDPANIQDLLFVSFDLLVGLNNAAHKTGKIRFGIVAVYGQVQFTDLVIRVVDFGFFLRDHGIVLGYVREVLGLLYGLGSCLRGFLPQVVLKCHFEILLV